MLRSVNVVAAVLVALVALIHVYIVVLEMFLWTKPQGRAAFGTDAEFAEASKTLAANQGLYNGFLVAGLVWGLVADKTDVQVFFLLCVIVAGRVRRRDGQPPDPARAGATGRPRARRRPRRRADGVGAALQPAAERLEVGGRLAAQVAPLPLLADRGGEPQLEDGVERLVGVGQHRPEQPVQLVGRHRRQRQPGVEVDVAEPVDGERHGVHPQVPLQQPAVDAPRGSRRGRGTRTRGSRARAARRRAGRRSAACARRAARS